METIIPKYSSSIAMIIYNRIKNALTIEFKSGKRYRYYNVSVQKFARFKNAKSKGSYFANYIRGKYEMRRLALN
jgi:hypothetical protein